MSVAVSKMNGRPRPVSNRLKPIVAPRAGSISSQVRRLNHWRDNYNPLRQITFQQAVALLETYRLGWLADLQWAYSYIEETDEDLFALIERRTSSILEFDWNIKLCDDDPNFNQALADDQAATLREAYERIDNLHDGIEHLCMASFRGYSLMEKQAVNGDDIDHLEIVDHWNLVRDGSRGDWKYNPDASQTSFAAIAGPPLPLDRFIRREVSRHIDRIGLIKFMRTSLGIKDWTAFVEVYGVPSGIAIMPPSVPPGKETEYEEAARRISEGGSGALPNGSDYKPNDQPRGTNPFKDYLDYLSQKLVLVGTGGLLTMLTQSGSGTLAGEAHLEVFDRIARAEARKINQSFNRDFDAEVLEANFPGQPRLAYWELAAQEETETSQVCDEVLKLSQAGYQVDTAELSEKTGYTLEIKPPVPAPGFGGAGNVPPLNNRAVPTPAKSHLPAISKARAITMQPLLQRLQTLEKAATPEDLRQAIIALHDEMPALAEQIHQRPELAQTLFNAMAENAVEGAAAELRKKGTML